MPVFGELFFHVSSKFAFTRRVFRCRGHFVLALASVLFLAGCDGGGGGGGGNPGRSFSSLNIADATALIITRPSGSGSANAAMADGERRLFKITNQGVVVEVDYFDENDQLVQEIAKPVYVYDLNEQYFFFQFGFGEELLNARISYPAYEFEEAVLVRKSDGAVFDSPWGTMSIFDVDQDEVTVFGNSSVIVADDNLYYSRSVIDGVVEYNTIRRVDVGNPDQLLDSQVSADLHNVSGGLSPPGIPGSPPYFVDASGNVFYQGTNVVSGLGVRRVIMPDGTGIAFTGFTPFMIGLDGAIYGFDFSGSGDLLRANIDASGNFATSFYATIPGGFLSSGGWWVSLPGKIIYFEVGGRTIIEIFNASGVPVELTSLNGLFSQLVSVKESPNYIYMFGVGSGGGTTIMRIDPVTYAVTSMVDSAEFEIFRFVVTTNDEVIFDAIRISDSARVQAMVDQSFNLTIISEASGAQEPVIVERLQ